VLLNKEADRALSRSWLNTHYALFFLVM